MCLTHGPHGPVVDELAGAEGKVLEGEVLQFPLSCLEAVVHKEHNGSVVPAETNRETGGVTDVPPGKGHASPCLSNLAILPLVWTFYFSS